MSNQYKFALDNLQCILIEDVRSTVTIPVLNSLSKNGVLMLICDDKHLPNAQLVPIQGNGNQRDIFLTQLHLSKAYKSRLWKSIIKAKVINQAMCLRTLSLPGDEKLRNLAKLVKNDDSTCVEANAARIYFKYILNGLTRVDDFIINQALNYGYTILRSYIIRQLSLNGFEPMMSLKHSSKINRFPLADDLIEPFRPVIDLYVYNYMKLNTPDVLSTVFKAHLLNTLNLKMMLKSQKFTVAKAIEIMIESLIHANKEEHSKAFILPVLVNIETGEIN